MKSPGKHRLLSVLSCICMCMGPALVANAQKLPEGKGKAVVEAACDGCHGMEQLQGRAWSKAKWLEVVKKMEDKGATLSDEERTAVVDYLAANFGEPKAKVGKR